MSGYRSTVDDVRLFAVVDEVCYDGIVDDVWLQTVVADTLIYHSAVVDIVENFSAVDTEY